MSDALVLDLQDVAVRYKRHMALDGMTAASTGGAIGLLGPNGAGKSSLIKALLGLVPLARGTARVLGDDVQTQRHRLRRRLGYMPERDAAFPHLTGFQATWYAGRLAGMADADARRRAHEVLHFAGLDEARYRDVSTYSTGMRQRVKLAQALVHDPDLVFLDEPTNGLDPKGRDEMLGLIKTLSARGVHVLLSSHLLRDVEDVCASVLVLRQGKLVRHETIESLRRATADAFSVSLRGDAAPFRAACEQRGLQVRAGKGLDLEVTVPPGTGAKDVFAAAEASAAVVRKLVPMRVTLEDALLDVLGSAG